MEKIILRKSVKEFIIGPTLGHIYLHIYIPRFPALLSFFFFITDQLWRIRIFKELPS